MHTASNCLVLPSLLSFVLKLVRLHKLLYGINHSAMLPSMEQFSIIDKNKGMCCAYRYNKYFFNYLAVLSKATIVLTSIYSTTVPQKIFYLTFLVVHSYVTLGCHDWATLFPSMDHKHNVGKCRFARAVVYYIL